MSNKIANYVTKMWVELVLEGRSESVGKTDLGPSPYNVQVKSLRWPASTRSRTHMPLVKHCQ